MVLGMLATSLFVMVASVFGHIMFDKLNTVGQPMAASLKQNLVLLG